MSPQGAEHVTIVVVKRSLALTKEQWRALGTRRMLPPFDASKLLGNVWLTHRAELPARGFLQLAIAPDGTPRGEPTIRELKNGQRALLSVFECGFSAETEARVVLREEACTRSLGVPRRETRTVAQLQPWSLVRVLLNGRVTSYAGQTYHLREYTLGLCMEPMPMVVDPAKLIDLQADVS